ncbi:uncharacterized protein ALTATR162_LOCUS5613 [Alternaria atra]|uniref:Uncharacterized protein n=1 Tax=Alternaria atra TaxID=119953 RepID=A0A8J2N1U3_9PLEO|nr:uncharacterized protein ALTATR162_LOCUS5613 [Alternaria atra]CAG5159500.1 unnamed protein product [Alternaria atra]
MKLILALVLRFFCLQTCAVAQQLPTRDAWWYSVCRGSRLSQAMVWSPPYATDYLDPIDSPWDGVMHQEFAQWGYMESERSQLCDFGTFWGLGRAFGSLGIDPRSNFNHGPNRCFRISHGDPTRKRPDGRSWPLSEQTYISPNGRSNRVTGAFSDIGVNPDTGVVFFMSRRSAIESARILWRQDPPSWNELPGLRSNSDFAWAFWNRMPHFTPITAFWSISVSNRQTLNILNLAFRTYKPPPGQQKVNSIQDWPGTDFEITSIEALAILGECNPSMMAANIHAFGKL